MTEETTPSDDKYVPPKVGAGAFHCPNCGAFAHQHWVNPGYRQSGSFNAVQGLSVAFCSHCKMYSVWVSSVLVHPPIAAAPRPHPMLPIELVADFEEARAIAGRSSRGAAALLRLVIQKLCVHLKQPGRNLNDDIGALVKLGLPTGVQQALDVLRVVGNNSVHPGELDIRDTPEVATKLFKLVNIIAEKMIAEPKELKALFEALPDGAKKQIKKRDATT